MLSEQIVAEVDAGRVAPWRHAVARALAVRVVEPSPLHAEVLSLSCAGHAIGDSSLLARVWTRIDPLPPAEQGRFRLLLPLFRPDAPVDWEIAEYLILWAQQSGVTAATIREAFGVPA